MSPKYKLCKLVLPGLTESIIAAAVSRIDKTVLHLDRNDYYGGFWASFSLEALQTLAAKEITPSSEPLFESESLKIFPEWSHIENVDMRWLEDDPESVAEDTEQKIHSREALLKKSRNFNIDLMPTLLYSLGGMVKLLISSNICRYAEFRAIDRVATLLNGEIKTVPCSRSDVFVTNEVNVVEKRIMMKLIETCMELKDREDQEEFNSYKEKTFQEFLVAKRAPAKVQHYLMNALSMVTPETSFEIGVSRLNKFVESLGRYGNSPFLFPMYGCGEIPQCFCRLCAVFGGIYCLQRGLKSIEPGTEGNKLKVELETGEEVSVGNIVFGPRTIRTNTQRAPEVHLARAVLIVDQPLKDTNEKPKGGGVEFLRMTHENSEAFLIQLSHYSGCCPKDVYLYHLIGTTSSDTLPRKALQPFLDQLFIKGGEDEQSRSKIIFELFFTIPLLNNEYQVSVPCYNEETV